MKRLIQLEGMGRVIGHIFILIVIFLAGRSICLEVENRFPVNEKKYEQLQSAIYENTGVIKIDYSPTDIACPSICSCTSPQSVLVARQS